MPVQVGHLVHSGRVPLDVPLFFQGNVADRRFSIVGFPPFVFDIFPLPTQHDALFPLALASVLKSAEEAACLPLSQGQESSGTGGCTLRQSASLLRCLRN